MSDSPHRPDPPEHPPREASDVASASSASSSSPPPPPPPPAEPAPTGGDPTLTPAPTTDEQRWAILAHLLGIVTWFVGALVIWLVKRDTMPFVDDQGREALNFQITVTVGYVVAMIASGVIGCFATVLWTAVWVLNIIFCLIAALAASRGEMYRYPINVRLV